MAPRKLITLGRRLAPAEPVLSGADWKQANPRWIRRALERTQARSGGGWFVIGASRTIGSRPRCYTIDGHRLVVFRSGDQVIAGPNECPHMGASLAEGRVEGGRVICPWHGLALGERPHGSWRPRPTFDDGVLAWVRLAELGDDVTDRPTLPSRPARFIDGVISREARCEPEDVIANRLDPWHGAHYHPYSFGRLAVIEQGDDEITVRVVKRVFGRVGVEVDARFHSPEPRTIAMTIVAGEGAGSVVETHATPIAPGRTMVIEASLAASDRPGFRFAVPLARLIRPLLERSAERLWVDDCAYAERLYELRTRSESSRDDSAAPPRRSRHRNP